MGGCQFITSQISNLLRILHIHVVDLRPMPCSTAPGTKKDKGSAIRPFFSCLVAGKSWLVGFILKPKRFQMSLPLFLTVWFQNESEVSTFGTILASCCIRCVNCFFLPDGTSLPRLISVCTPLHTRVPTICSLRYQWLMTRESPPDIEACSFSALECTSTRMKPHYLSLRYFNMTFPNFLERR